MKLSLLHQAVRLEAIDPQSARPVSDPNAAKWWQFWRRNDPAPAGGRTYFFDVPGKEGGTVKYGFYSKVQKSGTCQTLQKLLRRNGYSQWPPNLSVAIIGFYMVDDQGRPDHSAIGAGTGQTGAVLATVRAATEKAIAADNPDIVLFTAIGGHEGRTNVYGSMLRRFLSNRYKPIPLGISKSAFILVRANLANGPMAQFMQPTAKSPQLATV